MDATGWAIVIFIAVLLAVVFAAVVNCPSPAANLDWEDYRMHGRKRTPHDTHPTYASSADYPTQDGSDRCANDQQIRALGFTILRRQKGRAAVWQDREGREYSQEECERLVLGLEDASAAASKTNW